MAVLEELRESALEQTHPDFMAAYPYPVLVSHRIHHGILQAREIKEPPMPRRGYRARPAAVGSFRRQRHGRRFGRTSGSGARQHTMIHQVGSRSGAFALAQSLRLSTPGYGGGFFLQVRPLNGEDLPSRSAEDTELGPILIGRSSVCDIVLNDYSVSQVHGSFSLDLLSGRATYIDGGSTNGSFQGARRLGAGDPLELQDGDQLRMGRLTLGFFWPERLYHYLRAA